MRSRTSKLPTMDHAVGTAKAFSVGVLFAFSLANAAAETFSVTTNADAGADSLRQAIMDANSQPGPDAIFFSNVTGTIFLTASLPVIAESLSIIGPGRDLLTISGGGACRVFHFGAATNSISGLTISNGLAPVNENGGGIWNGSNLSISNCSIVGCQTRGGFGGGIYNQGDLSLIGSTLAGNNAKGGDGHSGIQSGSSGGGGGGFGGGVFTTYGRFQATNCFFIGNEAVGGSGGPANSSTIFAGAGGVGGGLNGGLGGGIYVPGDPGGFGGGGGGGGPDLPKGGNGGFGGGGGGGGILGNTALGGIGGGYGGAINGSGTGGASGGGGAGIGGGLFQDSGDAVIVDLAFSDNLATGGSRGGSGGYGGGDGSGLGNDVYTRTGSLIVTNHPKLSLISQGVGTIAKVPDQEFYTLGEPVALSATPARWHVFSGWTDGSTNNPRVVTIGESNIYTAVFTPTTPLETVTVGSVSRLAPIGMPAAVVDGAFIVVESVSARGLALVTLATTFASGSLFYTLNGSDPAVAGTFYAGPFTVRKSRVLRTIAYNADFSQAVVGDPLTIVILPTLTGLTEGGGSIAIEPAAGDYFSNALAHVTATAAPGWTFLHWLGDATGTNPAVSLTMTRSKAVRAVFGTELNTTTVGGGSLVVDPISALYPYGSQVRFTAVPATGNYLAFWANAASGMTDNPLTFTISNANPTVTAVFASLGGPQTNALTVIPDGRGQVTLTPPGNRFRVNTNVVLQATPEAGQEFFGWAGAASGTENPLVVTMNSNKVITANFTRRPRLEGEGNPDMLNQDGFRLTLTGELGTIYEILGSTDFSGWTSLGTVTNTWGVVQFTDPEATTNANRAYRARAVE